MKKSKIINEGGQITSGKSESKIQSDCVLWLWNKHPETRGLFCYNLNNSKNKIDGALNKAKGLIAGRSDTVFYWKSKAYMIEFKTETGVQNDKQIEWQNKIKSNGFEYHIIKNLENFKLLLTTILQ